MFVKKKPSPKTAPGSTTDPPATPRDKQGRWMKKEKNGGNDDDDGGERVVGSKTMVATTLTQKKQYAAIPGRCKNLGGVESECGMPPGSQIRVCLPCLTARCSDPKQYFFQNALVDASSSMAG